MKRFLKTGFLFALIIIIILIKVFNMPRKKDAGYSVVENAYINRLKQDITNLTKETNLDYNLNTTIAKRIYIEPYTNASYMKIKMASNIVSKGDYVINDDGYIGKIVKIKGQVAKVELITSRSAQNQVQINECFGIMKWKKNKAYVTNIKSNCSVKENDIVNTSSLSTFNEKIKIGKVTKKINSTTYEVLPFINFDNISYVLVLSESGI